MGGKKGGGGQEGYGILKTFSRLKSVLQDHGNILSYVSATNGVFQNPKNRERKERCGGEGRIDREGVHDEGREKRGDRRKK